MYLSRIVLNPLSRSVWKDLADCQSLHRTIMSGFLSHQLPGDARASLEVLHRLDVHPMSGEMALLVQSAVEPDWSRLEPGYLAELSGREDNPATKAIGEQYGGIRTGNILSFRLAANPARKIDTRSGPAGERRNGRRVEIQDEAAQLEWLQRKSEHGGFHIRSVRVRPPDGARGGKIEGTRNDGQGKERITFGGALFEGELVVSDAALFLSTLRTGVGSGKAYGFGLLSVGPPRR